MTGAELSSLIRFLRKYGFEDAGNFLEHNWPAVLTAAHKQWEPERTA